MAISRGRHTSACVHFSCLSVTYLRRSQQLLQGLCLRRAGEAHVRVLGTALQQLPAMLRQNVGPAVACAGRPAAHAVPELSTRHIAKQALSMWEANAATERVPCCRPRVYG
jgi:hypothetical protein